MLMEHRNQVRPFYEVSSARQFPFCTNSGRVCATDIDMGLYEFLTLNKDERASMVWEEGVFLLSRSHANGKVNLYGIDSFYVEVYYNPELNCVEDIRSFQTVQCLEPYLDLMDIGYFSI